MKTRYLIKELVLNLGNFLNQQELEEPGEDTTKYDVFAPAVVCPKKPDLIKTSQSYITDDVSKM